MADIYLAEVRTLADPADYVPSGFSDADLVVTRSGDIVAMMGTVKTVNALTTTGAVTLFNIPSGYQPGKQTRLASTTQGEFRCLSSKAHLHFQPVTALAAGAVIYVNLTWAT